MNTPMSPFSGSKASPTSRWKCLSCGNYNLLKKDKCPKCTTPKPSMTFDDYIPLTRSDFIKKSTYLTNIEQKWRKQIIKSKTISIMREESNRSTCLSLKQCACAKRAVFIQNLYRDWCKAHNSLKIIYDNDVVSTSSSSSSSLNSTGSAPPKKSQTKKPKPNRPKSKTIGNTNDNVNDTDIALSSPSPSSSSSSPSTKTKTKTKTSTPKKRKKKKKKKGGSLTPGQTPKHRLVKSTPLTQQTLKSQKPTPKSTASQSRCGSKKRRKKRKKHATNSIQKRKRTQPSKVCRSPKLKQHQSLEVIKKEPNLPPTTVKKMPKPSMSMADIIQKY